MRNGSDRESNPRPQRWQALMLISNIAILPLRLSDSISLKSLLWPETKMSTVVLISVSSTGVKCHSTPVPHWPSRIYLIIPHGSTSVSLTYLPQYPSRIYLIIPHGSTSVSLTDLPHYPSRIYLSIHHYTDLPHYPSRIYLSIPHGSASLSLTDLPLPVSWCHVRRTIKHV
jgi:hypothetical protein